MCIAGIITEHPQLADAIPSAERLSELGARLGNPSDAAICHTSAAVLRHVHELVVDEERYSIDDYTRGVVLATLRGVRGLAEIEVQVAATLILQDVWNRAIALIDNAIAELEL